MIKASEYLAQTLICVVIAPAYMAIAAACVAIAAISRWVHGLAISAILFGRMGNEYHTTCAGCSGRSFAVKIR